MSLRDDDRAQSLQVGAVLLFGVLVVLLATYQAVVVPNQNRQVEARHVDAISEQMADLRNAIVSIPGGGSGRSVTLALGTTYPGRIVAVNPPPPTGELRTRGTAAGDVNLTVANAVATDADVDDAWDGTNRTYATGALAYEPGYNEYPDAPTIVYENSLLYHRFPSGNLTRAGQRVVDGRRLTLVALNGSIDTSAAGAVAVDLEAVSASSRRIAVRNEPGDSLVLAFASRLDADRWRAELRDDDEFVDQSGHVVGVTDEAVPGTGFRVVRVELEAGVTYALRMAKVGVGTGVEGEGPAYLVDDGGDRTVQEGSRVDVAVEVRDRLNNPVAGVPVDASVESGPQHGSLASTTVETDEAGRAVFEYRAAPVDDVAQRVVDLNLSYAAAPGSDFDASAPENVTVEVTVENTDRSGLQGGPSGSPTSLSWVAPTTDNSGGLSSCSADECTFDVGAHGDADLTLRVETDPTFPTLDVEFGVNNSSVGTVGPNSTTDSVGEATTTFSASENGTVAVLAGSNAGSAVLTLHVENAGPAGGQTPTVAARVDDLTRQNTNQPAFIASYDVSNANDSFERVDVTFTHPNGPTTTLSGSGPRGGVRYAASNGAGGSFDVTYEVVYTDAAGTEYVAASRTVTDEADAVNPSANEDLSTGQSVQLTSWTIEDRSQTNNDSPRYRYTYDATGTGNFSEVRAVALNLPGSGESDVGTFTSRSQQNQDVQLGYGAGDEYRVGLLVRDADGVVVDVVSRTDAADGTGTFSGP